MSTIGNALPTTQNSDFKLRHWRSPPVPRPPFLLRKDPSLPAVLNLRPDANSELEHSNWNSDTYARDGYTSIRDLLVSSPRSCVASPTATGCEIQIRNPLVKQAVYAYLHLTPSCTGSSSSQNRPLRRLLEAIKAAFRPLRCCFEFIGRILCCASVSDLR
ncbi:hypothetical protein KSP39_PZI005775 [Platanthera zijinensis]|uniref:Uncharacterized protein n=1 Tax=Platanthera zijinensis TaxID=2320716 RepID=A0AAP0BUU8_9ASPA